MGLMKTAIPIVTVVIMAAGCGRSVPEQSVPDDRFPHAVRAAEVPTAPAPGSDVSETEKKFVEAGLVDIATVDASIRVNLVNSDPTKNFFRMDFYDGLTKAYLRKAVADRLSAAQKHLASKRPGHSLVIMDAARPRSVSQLMYDRMKGTKFEKFVANPQTGSMHNYGIAVDVTIADGTGELIDMGFTPFYKSDYALCVSWAKHQKYGLSQAQTDNRNLLSGIMRQAGFIPLSYEWWHFNGMEKDEAREMYQIIE